MLDCRCSERKNREDFAWVWSAAATATKLLQLCPTLCDPIDSSPPGSAVSEILQARSLEWVAIFFSNAWKWKVKVKSLSRVWLFETPWTATYQPPLSMGFSRQEYWSGLPLPPPESDLDPGNSLVSLSQSVGEHLFLTLTWAPRRLSAEELMLSNFGAVEDSWDSFGQQGDQTSQS